MESPQPLRPRAIAALTRALAAWARACVLFGIASAGWGAQLDRAAQAQIEQIVTAQIEAQRLPGAVIVVGDAQHVLYRATFGQRAVVPRSEPMTPDTEFDLASLTKVVATTTAIMQLAEGGRLQLDAPAARYWPAFAVNGKAAVTVRELLAHTSGLPAELPLPPPGHGRARILRDVAAAALVAAPGNRVIYSDVNFIALGELVERMTHRSLDAYCREHIFAPLGMRDTMFLPDALRVSRSAPTTADRVGMRRGAVHDPVASRMGGVAGNAGLFSTADDLARFAQMLLRDGTSVRHVRVLAPTSIAAFATPNSPLAQTPWRGVGWELAAPMVTNRDRLPPAGAIGHTGYTGTGLWIDFVSGRFAVILTNRVHPDDSGDARPLRAQVLALLASRSAPASTSDIVRSVPEVASALAQAGRLPASAGPVRAGIDVLEEQRFGPLAGLRIGLLTNRSGFDALGRRTIDVLMQAPGVKLAALFSPEHGMNADVDAPVSDTRDPATGLVVHSLYGRFQRFPPESLDGLDALVVDIQDAGVRLFTYETTLGYALEAAAAQHIPIFVLDRPAPLGGDRFGGPTLDAGQESFTGYHPLPLVSGMTVGELASLFNDERHIGADLRVIRMHGYTRSMRFADTGLGWIPLSPNLRTLEQLDRYPDLVLLEGANVSVGRGTPAPFGVIGAPWIDGPRLAAALNAANAGARFEPFDFVPTESVWHGVVCHGVRIVAADPSREPGRLGLAMLATLHALYPQTFDLAATQPAVGSSAVGAALAAGADPDRVAQLAELGVTSFARLRTRYLLY
ncbi:DUF1343 domain-containing protein [Paraburkholderia sp. NMBU_R16]|uniref:serine hydrolase n=1 Tax=Paraburkholderia sp. NMBU_R16 TaxID=2698676 RepID=UPI001565AD4F|nr:serine hydrolase [Paraburkholderia sp. NMBU_R16]NRO96967.1 DUF1343 domain-containing protein [Paraburkholderia sp. NMBU_R16]